MAANAQSQLSDGDRLILDTVEVPQANDLLKVFRVADLIAGGANTPSEVADGLGVVDREGAYYLSAARAVRLVRTVPSATPAEYVLAYLGDEYVASTGRSRTPIIVRGTLVAPHVVFVAERLGLLTPLSIPTPRELRDATLVERELIGLGPLSGATPGRRSSTLVSWMKTIDRLARQPSA